MVAEPVYDKAQEMRASVQAAWRGNPLPYDAPGGLTVVLDAPPALIMDAKQQQVIGLDAMVRLFDAQGREQPIDPHRRCVNPPMLVPDLLAASQTVLIDDPVMGKIKSLRPAYKRDPQAAYIAWLTESVTETPHPRGFGTKGTVDTIYSSTADGYVYNHQTKAVSYADVHNGLPSVGNIDASGTRADIGQYDNGDWFVFQSFLGFDTSGIGADPVSSAILSLYGNTDESNTDQVSRARLFDWSSGGLTTADFRPGNLGLGADITDYTLLCHLTSAGWNTSGYNAFVDDAFAANVNGSGTTYIFLHSDRQEGAGTAPSGPERVSFYTAEQSGTTQDPKLVVTHGSGQPTWKRFGGVQYTGLRGPQAGVRVW